ncbi:MAG: hypothetical protein KUA43_12505 [Hoeflea sp.]|uniref:hypothetical protein n=1 Tax=Hoeflea sp. TaxID=1940281 RepID=UPI001D937CA2|nr:hypothetical protein [Hoeflea sp.]MBU4527833.1 hypothetical protein [Alphaproteobacteria bacterium]MBU4546132.1 hypothetical protein [Alphaproteobacteria bacterium]MBU4553183.1 hypothetical protein [Alphaproteobacteria bacterium]MBV1724255.1 hypothetical protein [Hoeflea sp.]MBV1759940.1 hypothetical protein [Hoeflea sp.]
MRDMSHYYGLIEIALTFGGFMLFIVWQVRTLKRDIRAREAREAAERAVARPQKAD